MKNLGWDDKCLFGVVDVAHDFGVELDSIDQLKDKIYSSLILKWKFKFYNERVGDTFDDL